MVHFLTGTCVRKWVTSLITKGVLLYAVRPFGLGQNDPVASTGSICLALLAIARSETYARIDHPYSLLVLPGGLHLTMLAVHVVKPESH